MENNTRVYTNQLNSIKLGPPGEEAKITIVQGFLFQRQNDAANNDPVVKATQTGKHYATMVTNVAYNAAKNAFDEEALPPADENGNIRIFINFMLSDEQKDLLLGARAVSGDTIEVYGNAVVGKAAEGRLPSLWLLNAQVIRLKAKKADGGAVKIEKNIASVRGKGYQGTEEVMSYLRGKVMPGYDGAPAVTTGVTKTGKNYSRFTVETVIDSHEHAVAFGAPDNGSKAVGKKRVRCSAWGFANDRVQALGLMPGDEVVLLGSTSQYNNERNSTVTDQMNVSRVVSRFKAKTEDAPAAPLPAQVKAPVAPEVTNVVTEDLMPSDDFDLPF